MWGLVASGPNPTGLVGIILVGTLVSGSPSVAVLCL